MSEPVIIVSKEGGIATVTLNRPEKLNALNRDLRGQFCRVMQELRADPKVGVVIITGAGRAFCAGLDLRELGAEGIREDGNATFITVIEDMEVPVIAAVNGFAVTGGFELALACDFLVAADNAVLRCVEVTTAMLPIAGALQRIAERAGRARASRFAMLGEPISGHEAGALGIATHVVPEKELAATAAALVKQLVTGPTRSYAATRTLLKAWSSGGVAAADLVMLDVAMELYDGPDAQRGFANTADAFNKDIEPPTLVFEGK